MSNDNKKYKDKEWMKQKYITEQLTPKKIGEISNSSKSTVYRWLDKHEIEKRDRSESQMVRHGEKIYKSKEWLEKKYWDEGLSMTEMSKIANCDKTTIRNWIIRHDIEQKGRYENVRKAKQKPYANLKMDSSGYMRWQNSGTDRKEVGVHQLLAIHNGEDPHFVFRDDTDVHHHPIPIPWANWPENIEPMTTSEHVQWHWKNDRDKIMRSRRK